MSTYTLKLAVDKSRNRVVFAESDEDFVEVLLCFLKVPLGYISCFCGNNSSIGSIDNLYRSVEDLDDKYFNTNASRDMLLFPRIADKHLSDSLSIFDTSTHLYYCCFCVQKPCGCGQKMDRRLDLSLDPGPFFKGNMRFLITDDMVITLSSSRRIMDLTCKHGDKIEFQEVTVGKEEIIKLLKKAALNKMSFTSVFVGETNEGLQLSKVKEEAKSPRMSPKSDEKKMIKLQKDVAQFTIVNKENENAKGESNSEEVEKTITVNLLVDKRNRKVLYAEYSSCRRCAKPCSPLIHVDLKQHGDTSIERGFMEKANYMVTDDLVITPFCSISSYSLLNKAGFLQQCVEEKTFRIGPKEAKKLLQTCLTSKTPLTDAFLL